MSFSLSIVKDCIEKENSLIHDDDKSPRKGEYSIESYILRNSFIG